MKKEKTSKLKVAEALQDDAYKGIVRVDSKIMKSLGIKRGDVIQIKGNRESVAIVDKAYPADAGEKIIRMDSIIRRNVRVGIGDSIHILKAIIKEAKKVVISPAQKGIMVQAEPENLKRGLLGRSIVKGDVVVLGGVQKRKDLFSEMGLGEEFGNLFGEEFENMFGDLGGGIAQIKFVVVNTNPGQQVIITENTEVYLKNLKSRKIRVNEEELENLIYNVNHVFEFLNEEKLNRKFVRWLKKKNYPITYQPLFEKKITKKKKKRKK